MSRKKYRNKSQQVFVIVLVVLLAIGLILPSMLSMLDFIL